MVQPSVPPWRFAGRAGFTFIELIVGLAIVVMIAAVVTPAVTGSLDRTRVGEAADMLAGLAASFPGFHDDVGDHPGRLHHLGAAGISTSEPNSCGASYPNGHVNKWDGPYYGERNLDGTPLPVFVGLAQDALVRLPGAQGRGSGNTGLLGIVITGVREQDALALDQEVDGGAGPASGTIQWDAPDAEGTVVMRYLVPISGC